MAADETEALSVAPDRSGGAGGVGTTGGSPTAGVDRCMRLAARVFRVPLAAAWRAGDEGLHLKVSIDLPGTGVAGEAIRTVVAGGAPWAASDVRGDPTPRARDLGSLGMVACLGVPVPSPSGAPLGSIWVFDDRPRAWSEEDLATLGDLAEALGADWAASAAGAGGRRDEDARARAAVVEQCGDFIAVATADGRLRYVNAAGLSWLDPGGRGHAIGTPIAAFFDGPTRERLEREGLPGALATGRWEGSGRLEGEPPREVQISLFRLTEAGADVPAGLAAVLRDLGGGRRIEDDLRRAKEQADAANRAKSEFLANMSHEVRTPIAAILGHTDLLIDDELTPEARGEAIGAIRRNGRHLLQIINDVLDLSKIEAGKLEIAPIPYAPWQIVLEAVAALRVAADDKGVRLRATAAGSLPPVAEVDPTRLRQVLVNLVSNAVKFTEAGGTVEVEFSARPRGAWADRAWLRFEVRDPGIGMSPEQMSQLFRPFQQGDSSTTRKYGGTGLGLSISRRLIDAMGGEIVVSSAPGRGSRFVVTIPTRLPLGNGPWVDPPPARYEQGACAPPLPPPPPPRAPHGGRKPKDDRKLSGRVLLAEDSADNRRVIVHHLRRAGLDVAVADNGREAVEAVLAGRPRFDAVLMDMQMPEMDGYAAAASLRHLGYPGPIIALTAHAMHGDRERCLGAGCSHYLSKPVDPKLLIETIARGMLSTPADEPAPAPEDDPELAALVAVFAAAMRERVGLLRDAAGAGDLAAVRTLAHQTKGSAGMYGFPGLGEVAAALERLAAAGAPAARIAEGIDAFARAVAAQIPPGPDGPPGAADQPWKGRKIPENS